MKTSIIAAVGRNMVIGSNNRLPWQLPADLAYFIRVTFGHTVVMGRKTFESIGAALPDRENIVLTRDPHFSADGCKIMHSVDEVLRNYVDCNKEIFIIGGEEVYRQFLPYSQRMYITCIDHDFVGDAFFPEIKESEWYIVETKKGVRDWENAYDYNFIIYERRYRQRTNNFTWHILERCLRL